MFVLLPWLNAPVISLMIMFVFDLQNEKKEKSRKLLWKKKKVKFLH